MFSQEIPDVLGVHSIIRQYAARNRVCVTRIPGGIMSEENTDTEKHFRIIILGAGFSCPAGLPLAAELFEEVRRRARVPLSGRLWNF